MLNQDDYLFYSRLNKFQRLYSKALLQRLDPHDVKPGYIDILSQLWAKDNVTQKELHSYLDIEQATLSNSLKRMERDGIISRKRNPKDRRITFIHLTEKGSGLKSVVNSAIDDLQNTINTGLTINDRRYFNRVLKQMTEHLEQDISDPTLILVDPID